MKEKQKSEKINVYLPKTLINKLRSIAPRGKRSAFIAEALQYYLRYLKQKEALRKGFGAWTDENHPDLKTPEDTVRYVNALRELDNEREEHLYKLMQEEPGK